MTASNKSTAQLLVDALAAVEQLDDTLIRIEKGADVAELVVDLTRVRILRAELEGLLTVALQDHLRRRNR